MTTLTWMREVEKWKEKFDDERKINMQLRYEISDLKTRLRAVHDRVRPKPGYLEEIENEVLKAGLTQ